MNTICNLLFDKYGRRNVDVKTCDTWLTVDCRGWQVRVRIKEIQQIENMTTVARMIIDQMDHIMQYPRPGGFVRA